MGWNVPRGRYGADALEPQEIQKLEAAPESASEHAIASGRRLLRRPTTAETERIARGCPPEGLSIPIPVIVDAIRRETGCSRATAYRAVADAFADGTLAKPEDDGA
jgi:hypothetical protein